MTDRLERVTDQQVVHAAHRAAPGAVTAGERVDGAEAPGAVLMRIPEENRRRPRRGERGEGGRAGPASGGQLRRLSGSSEWCQNSLLSLMSPLMLTPKATTTIT